MEADILIVDDEEGIRLSMQEFVTVSGFRTLTAESAEEALALLAERQVDVVITDIMLPGMDGLELTDVIKKDYNIDVIVLTGYSGDYSYEEAISKGASDLVFKPVRFEELLLRLKRVLKERKLTNERLQMLEKLKKLSITDGLTNLYNSRHFYNQLKGEVDRSTRYSHPLDHADSGYRSFQGLQRPLRPSGRRQSAVATRAGDQAPAAENGFGLPVRG